MGREKGKWEGSPKRETKAMRSSQRPKYIVSLIAFGRKDKDKENKYVNLKNTYSGRVAPLGRKGPCRWGVGDVSRVQVLESLLYQPDALARASVGPR